MQSLPVDYGELWYDFAPEDIPWEAGRLIYRQWLAKKGDRPFPARRDFTPRELQPTLPKVVLMDVPENPFDATIRLVGTGIADLFLHDPTGKLYRDLPNGDAAIRTLMAAIELGRPVFATSRPMYWAERLYRTYDSLLLPLGNSPERIDMHLHVLNPHSPKG